MSSYHIMLRDKIMAKLQAKPFFTGHGFHFHTARAVQIQPENIPFLGVYYINEVETGDNMGPIEMRAIARYGLSVIIQNNDPVAAESKLDEAEQVIRSLLNDPTMSNWENAGKPGEVAVQAFSRKEPLHVFGSVGADNTLPIAELRYDLTCDLGYITYPPEIDDNLNAVHITTQWPAGGTEAEIAATQQVQGHVWLWTYEPDNLTVMRPILGRPTLEQNP